MDGNSTWLPDEERAAILQHYLDKVAHNPHPIDTIDLEGDDEASDADAASSYHSSDSDVPMSEPEDNLINDGGSPIHSDDSTFSSDDEYGAVGRKEQRLTKAIVLGRASSSIQDEYTGKRMGRGIVKYQDQLDALDAQLEEITGIPRPKYERDGIIHGVDQMHISDEVAAIYDHHKTWIVSALKPENEAGAVTLPDSAVERIAAMGAEQHLGNEGSLSNLVRIGQLRRMDFKSACECDWDDVVALARAVFRKQRKVKRMSKDLPFVAQAQR